MLLMVKWILPKNKCISVIKCGIINVVNECI